ncbi:MOS1T transposase, partial [Pseudoatta argentina]
MIQKQGHWVPYELKPRDVERRFGTCELLLQRQKRKGFWHRIVTGDNPKRRKSWGKPGQISMPLYAQRHDKVILLHDNARPHVAKPVKTYLETLKWEVLPHPPHSPDIAPSDFHLFRSMKSAAEAHRILVQTYGDNALSDTTCRDWFRRFKNNDFQLEDKERSGAPKKFQDKELEQLLDEDPSQTLSELGKILQVDESTVSKRLKGLGMIQKQGHWVPRALKEKRPLYAQRHDKVILLHDNARPYVAKPVKTYLETLKWEVLPHPLYSPDIAPSDFHLFRSMAHGLADRRFHSYEEAQKWIDSWIASKDMSFFRRGIHVLPESWSKVVESDGKYFH